MYTLLYLFANKEYLFIYLSIFYLSRVQGVKLERETWHGIFYTYYTARQTKNTVSTIGEKLLK